MKKYIFIVAGLLLLGSCTKNFELIHDGYFGVTEADLTRDNKIVGVGYQNIMKDIYYSYAGWDYQTYQNLNADVFSGYMATPSFPGAGNLTYFLNNGWNDTCWGNGYNVMTNWLKNYEAAMRYGFPDEGVLDDFSDKDWKNSVYKHFLAVNTVCKVMGMSRMADQYGPIIYSQWGSTDLEGVAYDSLQDIYASFFRELTEAVEVLDWATKNPHANFAPFDIVYDGDMAKWARLANSLRLRLAMRMVKADPAEAQKQFEAAIAAPHGPMVKGDNYTMVGHNWFNSLWTCSVSYNDIFISANIESILSGYDDPRLPMFGMPVDGVVKGIRTGLPDTANLGSGTRKEQYLPVLSVLNVPNTDFRSIVVYAAETSFLKAEAALRGWNAGGGTAQSYYEEGVAMSFADWGVSSASYLTSSATPADYKDPLYPQFNIAAMSKVTPNWADATTDEERLEKIITQKWIANFPEGMNAWAEYRRTGYPKQFPIIDNHSQGLIPTELGVRRLTYTTSENDRNKAGVAGAVKHLGGPDTGATRVWWDVDKSNF